MNVCGFSHLSQNEFEFLLSIILISYHQMFHGDHCLVLQAIQCYNNCGVNRAREIAKGFLSHDLNSVQISEGRGSRPIKTFASYQEASDLLKSTRDNQIESASQIEILGSIKEHFQKVSDDTIMFYNDIYLWWSSYSLPDQLF